MAEVDFNSRVTTPRYGEPVTAGMMAKIKHLILNCVKAGNGIDITRAGQSVIISLKPAPKTGGMGSAVIPESWEPYTAASKALLPNTDIARDAIGFVTSGAQAGMMCVRNSTNTGWDAVNFWE